MTHSKQERAGGLAHGRVTGDIPEAKFREFEQEAKKRKQDGAGGSDAGLGSTGGAGEQ